MKKFVIILIVLFSLMVMASIFVVWHSLKDLWPLINRESTAVVCLNDLHES